jgi:hypothetical protein
MFSLSKNTSRAEQMAVNKLAMIVDVLIATSIDPDRSPITTTGVCSLKLANDMQEIVKEISILRPMYNVYTHLM